MREKGFLLKFKAKTSYRLPTRHRLQRCHPRKHKKRLLQTVFMKSFRILIPPKALSFSSMPIFDNITSSAYQCSSRVCDAEQHLVADMKECAPNEITNGKNLICDCHGRCKRKEEFEQKQVSKYFNLRLIGAPLLQLLDVVDDYGLQMMAVFYFFCPFEKSKKVLLFTSTHPY